MIPLPEKVIWERWVGMFTASYPKIDIPRPTSVKEWRRWASLFIVQNKLAFIVPTLGNFPNDEDWRIWVRFCIQESALL